MDPTLSLIRQARGDLQTVMVELAKAEYLLTAKLPQVAYLEDTVRQHVETLAAGLAALGKTRLEARGLYVPEGH